MTAPSQTEHVGKITKCLSTAANKNKEATVLFVWLSVCLDVCPVSHRRERKKKKKRGSILQYIQSTIQYNTQQYNTTIEIMSIQTPPPKRGLPERKKKDPKRARKKKLPSLLLPFFPPRAKPRAVCTARNKRRTANRMG